MLFPHVDERQQETVEEASQDLRSIFSASTITTTTFDDEMVTIFKDVLGMEITNDVAVALIGHGYTTWKLFRHMWLSDVDELKKSDGKGGMVLCMLAHRQKIERFVQDRE